MDVKKKNRIPVEKKNGPKLLSDLNKTESDVELFISGLKNTSKKKCVLLFGGVDKELFPNMFAPTTWSECVSVQRLYNLFHCL